MMLTTIMHISPGWGATLRTPEPGVITIERIRLTLVKGDGPVAVWCVYGGDAARTSRYARRAWPLRPDETIEIPPNTASPAGTFTIHVTPDAQEPLVEVAKLALEQDPLTIVRVEIDYAPSSPKGLT